MTNKSSKKPKYNRENIEKERANTTIIICPSCQGKVVFIDGQDSKTCPSCGMIVNLKKK